MRNKIYIVYKTTCLINLEIYVGVHSTYDLDNDCYFGSGKYLLASLNKYGIWNFEREVLYIYHSEKVAYAREKYIVSHEFLEREDTMNLKLGGYGGWACFRGSLGRKKRDNTIIERYGSLTANIHSLESREKVRQIKILRYGNGFGPINTPECIAKSLRTKKDRGIIPTHLWSKEILSKSLRTKKLKYGDGLRSSNPEITKHRKDTTMTKKYGSKVGLLHSKESISKAAESRSKSASKFREDKARKLYPDNSIKCKIIKGDEIIYLGDIYGASFLIGMGNRSDGKCRVLKSMNENIELRGRWSKHKIIKIEESSTTSA